MPLQDFFHQMHVLLCGYKLFSKLFSSFLLNIIRLTKHDICNIVTHPESIGKFCISVEAHHLCRFGSSPQPWSFQLARTTMLSPRRLMVLGLACVMACADDEACALQKARSKPKIRDNYVYFFHWQYGNEAPVKSVQFDETSYSITQGQPYEGVFTLGYYLDVRAGRQGSEEVANEFKAGIRGCNALGLNAFNALPYELNFAVFGTLLVTINDTAAVCPEMRIAQGHISTGNNWWIASTSCLKHPNGLTCPCGDTNVTFSGASSAKNYDFDVQFDCCEN